MKKKKDAVFDELKSQVVKPMKELVGIVRDHFAATANEGFFSAASQPKDWIAPVDRHPVQAGGGGEETKMGGGLSNSGQEDVCDRMVETT